MPTLPGSRGSSSCGAFVSVSWIRISRTRRKLSDHGAATPSRGDGLRRRQPMAAHDRCDRFEVRRAARRGLDDVGDIAEVVGPEDARSGDCQELCPRRTGIHEPVHLAAPDADRLTRADVSVVAVDGPRRDSVEPVDRLLEPVVTVRCGHPPASGDGALEHRDTAAGVVGVDEELDLDSAELDGFPDVRVHSYLPWLVKRLDHLTTDSYNGQAT